MQIFEVISNKDKKDFLLFPLTIYKDDPNWIRPLDKDIEAVFDPKQNKFFRHGQCIRFLLKEDGKIIGRIATFINEKTSRKEEQPTGGVGFFECINNRQAAHFMFDRCRQWLAERGMEAMEGPVNFGERDAWWGLMVEGFQPPLYKMNYNPPYYRELFESYGFLTWFDQWCYSLKVYDPVDEKFNIRHDEIAKNPDYKAAHLRKRNLNKYAEDFRIIYNKAWVKFGSGRELDSKQVRLFFQKMKPVIDEKVVWFVYYKDEPVAMWVSIPDINALFKKFNGKFGLMQKLWFMWMLRRRMLKKFVGIVFGIVPEHQGKGVDSYMIMEGANVIRSQRHYEDFELQWIGDFNPKMVSIAENLGTQKTRTLKTYRYLFDRAKEFKRHPVL